jgi:hypothetical protein
MCKRLKSGRKKLTLSSSSLIQTVLKSERQYYMRRLKSMARNQIGRLALNILQVSKTLFNKNLGVDLHFTILTNAKEILKIVKGIAEHNK